MRLYSLEFDSKDLMNYSLNLYEIYAFELMVYHKHVRAFILYKLRITAMSHEGKHITSGRLSVSLTDVR